MIKVKEIPFKKKKKTKTKTKEIFIRKRKRNDKKILLNLLKLN